MKSVWRVSPLAAVAALVAAAPALAASSIVVAQGQTGQYPWSLSMFAKRLDAQRLPGVCADFRLSSASGAVVINSGAPTCAAPSIGRQSTHGIRWSFDLHAPGIHGVVQLGSGITGFAPTGIRDLVFLVDPRARTVVATLADGETLRMVAKALPATLHRPARVAWSVSSVPLSGTFTPQQLNALTVRRAVVYDRRHRVVGRLP